MDAYLTAGERADLVKAGALLDRIMAYPKAGNAAQPKGKIGTGIP
jgi:hypothetical protein